MVPSLLALHGPDPEFRGAFAAAAGAGPQRRTGINT